MSSVERFPDRYETYIEQGGTNVSGGQNSVSALPEALLKKPKILILDDSTSAVDTATDAKIRHSFAEKIPGTTVFIIAQRISSVENADHVLVLDNGHISGFDTPENLLKTNAIYQGSLQQPDQRLRRLRRERGRGVMAQQAKLVGPGRNRGPAPQGGKPRARSSKRILAYVMHLYKFPVIAVLCCIFISVFAQVQGTLFMKTLIDGYITPMLLEKSSDFSGLIQAITRVALFYAVGILAIFLQNRTMARVTQGTLKNLRDEMFTHMQTLPIKYFDTHAHGDIMSVYTNDTDTLRQMISQSLPQLVNTCITVVSVLISMIVLAPVLTIVAVLMVGVMLLCTKFLTGRSGKFFVDQQRELGRVNGYIEEMMNGQKVVKVFCHEEAAIERFDELNDELFHSADKANAFALVAMPVNAQLGQPELCALRHHRRRHGHCRIWRCYAGQAGQLPGADPQLQPAHHPDLHAAELGGHGPGRRPAYLCAAG